MSVIKCLKNYLKQRLYLAVFLLLIILAVVFFTVIPPQILQRLIDVGFVQGGDVLNKLAVLYFCSFVCLGLADFLKQTALVAVSQSLAKEIRKNLLASLQKETYQKFVSTETGVYESYLGNDVEAVNDLVTSGAVGLSIDLLKIIGIVVSIFIYNAAFGLITLALLPVLFAITMFFRKKMFSTQQKSRKIEAQVNDGVLEALDNCRTVKTFSAYGYVKSRYGKVLEEHFNVYEKNNFYDAVFPPVMYSIKSAVIAAVILLAVGKNTVFGVTAGVLVGFIDLLTNLFSPIEAFGMELQTVQKSIAGIKRLDAFFKENGDGIIRDKTVGKSQTYTIRFDNVSFAYDGINNVVEDYSIMITTPQKVVFEGTSGAGKSTLFKLAYGILIPDRGRVTINGVDAYKLSIDSRNQLFGILFQDTFVSDGTVREELCLLGKADDRLLGNALKTVGLDNALDNLDEKNFINRLSNGERALFNLARLIVADRPIWFLDELNGKIDPQTVKKMLAIIEKIGENKMIICINHYGENLSGAKIVTVGKKTFSK